MGTGEDIVEQNRYIVLRTVRRLGANPQGRLADRHGQIQVGVGVEVLGNNRIGRPARVVAHAEAFQRSKLDRAGRRIGEVAQDAQVLGCVVSDDQIEVTVALQVRRNNRLRTAAGVEGVWKPHEGSVTQIE